MAKVYLDTAGAGFVAANNNAELIGSAGHQGAFINTGVSGVKVSSNVEDIDFENAISDYQFRQQQGTTSVDVFDAAGSQVATIAATGQTLSFADGTAQLSSLFSGIFGPLIYLGDTSLPMTMGTVTPAIFDTSDISSNASQDSGSERTQIYLGQNDARYVVANSSESINAGAGNQTIIINDGALDTYIPNTVEDIDFMGGAVNDFQFRQVGTSSELEVLNANGDVVANIVSVGQTLSFTDGTAQLGTAFSNGALTLNLGGTVLSQTAKSFTPMVFDTSDTSVVAEPPSDSDLLGTDGNDVINGTSGNDIIRGGKGVDEMNGGAGDDVFVVVGDVSAGGKVDTDEDTQALGFELSSLNFQNLNEDEDGAAETVIGGAGDDTLYVIGTADISNYDIQSVEHIEIRSDVSFDEGVFNGTGSIQTINGDGSSTLRIAASNANMPTVIDLSSLSAAQLSGINQIDVGANVELVIDSLAKLGDAKVLTGTGTIKSKDASTDFALTSRYSVQSTLNLKNSDGSAADTSAAVVIEQVTGSSGSGVIGGSDDDEYLVGTAADDVFYTGNGNDIISGLKGDDLFYVNGEGVKVIVDSDEATSIDRVDFSSLSQGVEFDLNAGGQSGNTSVSLGLANAGGANSGTSFNLMLILDSSGSMYGLNIDEAKDAALELITAYENLGDVAVRLIDFDSDAESDVGGQEIWLDAATAKAIIQDPSNFYASGGTDYRDALEQAIWAFSEGQTQNYNPLATNVSYFLSDGDPSWGGDVTTTLQAQWEQFLLDNQVISSAIGFDGINNTTELDPVAFDATKVVDSNSDGIIDLNDDLTAAQISPVIEVDTTNLGDTVVDQARLDFIENATGTDYDDVFTGNKLNNNIDGGAGYDRVNLSGTSAEYSVTTQYDTVTVTDLVSDRDGTNTFQNVEEIVFTDGSTMPQYSLPTLDEATQNYANAGLASDAEAAFFTLLGDLNVASYHHEPGLATHSGMELPSPLAQNNALNSFVEQSYERLKGQSLSFVDNAELGMAATGSTAAGASVAYNNGYYAAYDATNSAAAMVVRTADTLTVTFRGEDGSSNWFSSSNDLEDFFAPLLDQVQAFIDESSNGIEKVYVSGHSLSADIAMQLLNSQATHVTAIEQIAFAQESLSELYAARNDANDQSNVVHSIQPVANATLLADDYLTNIVKLADNAAVSGTVTLDAQQSSDAKLLVGNDNSNVLLASDSGSLLIGDLGGDKLSGGQGADILFGGSLQTLASQDALLATIEASHNQLSEALLSMFEVLQDTDMASHSSVAITDGVDSYLHGGDGSDVLIGNSGSDYFFMDTNLSSTAYLDTVYQFKSAGTDEDYLVFSQADLTLDDTQLASVVHANAIAVDGVVAAAVAADNLVAVDGIAQYEGWAQAGQSPEGATHNTSEALFILDYATGELYFDVDGQEGGLDVLLLAQLNAEQMDDNALASSQIVILGGADYDAMTSFA